MCARGWNYKWLDAPLSSEWWVTDEMIWNILLSSQACIMQVYGHLMAPVLF